MSRWFFVACLFAGALSGAVWAELNRHRPERVAMASWDVDSATVVGIAYLSGHDDGYRQGRWDADTTYQYGGIHVDGHNISLSYCTFNSTMSKLPPPPGTKVVTVVDSISSGAVMKGVHLSTVVLP